MAARRSRAPEALCPDPSPEGRADSAARPIRVGTGRQRTEQTPLRPVRAGSPPRSSAKFILGPTKSRTQELQLGPPLRGGIRGGALRPPLAFARIWPHQGLKRTPARSGALIRRGRIPPCANPTRSTSGAALRS